MLRRPLLLCFVVLAWRAAIGHADVTFLAPASTGESGSGTVTSWSYPATITAGGTNTIAFVGHCTANGAGDTVTSVTLGGVAMTLVEDDASFTTVPVRANLYRLVNPPTGTVTVAITISNLRRHASGTLVLQGVEQTTPVTGTQVAHYDGDGTTDTVSTTVTTTTGEMLVDLGCRRSSAETLTMGTQTNRVQRYTATSTGTTSSDNPRISGSTRTGTGALLMNWIGETTVKGMVAIGTNVQDAVVAAPAGRLSLGFKLLR